jgi:hypothetical protein
MDKTETPSDAPVDLDRIAAHGKLYELRPPARAPGGVVILGPDYVRVGRHTYRLNSDGTATPTVQ